MCVSGEPNTIEEVLVNLSHPAPSSARTELPIPSGRAAAHPQLAGWGNGASDEELEFNFSVRAGSFAYWVPAEDQLSDGSAVAQE